MPLSPRPVTAILRNRCHKWALNRFWNRYLQRHIGHGIERPVLWGKGNGKLNQFGHNYLANSIMHMIALYMQRISHHFHGSAGRLSCDNSRTSQMQSALTPIILMKYFNTSVYSVLYDKVNRAALTVLYINMAIVIGPTPPGTGVIIDALLWQLSKSASPQT